MFCFGLIDDIKDVAIHHLLLIARHFMYACRFVNTLPKLQVYKQLLINTTEIEKQIAFDNNHLTAFEKKWSRFKDKLLSHEMKQISY